MWYSIFVSSILRFSISETECTTLKNTPSLLASIASMRLFLLTFHILISNSGVETWHIIHLFHSTSFLHFLGLEGQSIGNSHYLSGGGLENFRGVNFFLYRYCGGQFLKPLSLGAVNLFLKHLVVKKSKSKKNK